MAAYATAPQRPVVNTCHGVAVTDNYQWLENADTGHGIGTALSDRIAEVTDYFCFLFEAPQIPVK
jgi:protease II